eukprot:12242719-Heterocapsa_arctica.AAC.1
MVLIASSTQVVVQEQVDQLHTNLAIIFTTWTYISSNFYFFVPACLSTCCRRACPCNPSCHHLLIQLVILVHVVQQ